MAELADRLARMQVWVRAQLLDELALIEEELVTKFPGRCVSVTYGPAPHDYRLYLITVDNHAAVPCPGLYLAENPFNRISASPAHQIFTRFSGTDQAGDLCEDRVARLLEAVPRLVDTLLGVQASPALGHVLTQRRFTGALMGQRTAIHNATITLMGVANGY